MSTMTFRSLTIALGLGLAPCALAAQTPLVVEHLRGLTVTIDSSQARPGGLLIVRLRPTRPIGPASALLDGRRAPFFSTREGPRALVGIPVTATPGPARLGLELRGRRGKRQLSIDFTIAAHPFGQRTLALPPAARALLAAPTAVRDSRRLLAAVRSASPIAHWQGLLRPPVDVPPRATFGLAERVEGGLLLDQLTDGIYGEYHRGVDYDVPPGTLVQSPGAGMVALAEGLTAAGQTVVIDHGHGLVSVISHLERIEVVAQQWIEGRTPLGSSGASGAVAAPHVHWATYLNGVAVDPAVLLTTGL
jgi:hypothetical protein